MKKKHAITSAIVLAVLAALVYSQFRHWRSFDWQQFWQVSKGVNVWMVLGGVVLIYLADVLRAVRWKIFLSPTCKTTVSRLIPSQFIGFTGLALLVRRKRRLFWLGWSTAIIVGTIAMSSSMYYYYFGKS